MSILGRLRGDEAYEKETKKWYEMIVTRRWKMVQKVIYNLFWEREEYDTHTMSNWQNLNIGDAVYGEHGDNGIQLKEDWWFRNKDKFIRWNSDGQTQ